MTEFVVYEDSPLAEYLESIDQVEQTVKVTPPHIQTDMASSGSNLSKRPSISRIWRHSMFHDAFSISLPRGEETAFEEKFKYLIVTSPLLNQVLSVQHHNRNKDRVVMDTFSANKNNKSNRVSRLGVTTNIVTTLALLFGAEKYLFPLPQQPSSIITKLPIITLFFSASASLFFLYRHKRRSSIRQLYQIALSRIQQFTDNSDLFDQKVHRCLITIQEIELVSRGYRLSTPLSPISRIEQNSKTKKCIQLRNKLGSVLRRAFIIYEEGIIDLMDVIHQKNLYTLYEMYNVNSIASLSALTNMEEEEGYSLDHLKKLAHVMHLKRRECMVHFLALRVMTEDHDSVRNYYTEAWRNINQVLGKLVDETEKFTRDILEALDAEFYKPINEFDKKDLTSKISDTRLKKFVHKLSCLEQQLRTMEAKIYLCSEDVRQLNSENSTKEVQEKLLNEYLSVQKGFESMASEWEIGRTVLESFLSPSSTTLVEQSIKQEEEQEEEEKKEEDELNSLEGKGIILDSEDVADILNLPMASKASVFEAIAGVVEKNGREKSKMTRKERIQEMRLKRVQENEEKANRYDSQTMVHELKSVLYKRINDLDLNEEEQESATSSTANI